MPQHTSHDYLTKFNSHFGFVEDEMANNIRNNNKIDSNNDFGEEYDANYFSKKRFRNVVPMGFVSKLNGEDDCFVFREFDPVTREGRKEDVKYFVSLMKESIMINDSYNSSSCQVVLVKLGKLGCTLDESKVIKLRHEFKSNTSLECNSVFWHHVCEERNSVSNTIKILIFTDRKYWTVYFHESKNSRKFNGYH